MSIWSYTHVLHLLTQWKLGSCFTFMIFPTMCSPSRWGILGIFLTIIHPHSSSLKWLGFACVWNSCFWVCCVCFPSRGQSFLHFPQAGNSFFCNDLWLGFFPNDFCCISPLFSKLKIIFVFPNDLEERLCSLGC